MKSSLKYVLVGALSPWLILPAAWGSEQAMPPMSLSASSTVSSAPAPEHEMIKAVGREDADVADSAAVKQVALLKAESIDLGRPLAEKASAVVAEGSEGAEELSGSLPAELEPFVLLGSEVPAATSTRLLWSPSQGFAGLYSPTPVLVVNGAKDGPTLCLTAAIHGDELNGIEMVRRVVYGLDPSKLSGSVIGVPIVNLQGFHRGTRYLTDRRDLNRYFPGDPEGSSAGRIAYSFFHEIIMHCDAVVDLHTGSFYRTNLPQLRADLTNPQVVKLTQGFGSTVVLDGKGSKGTLRHEAAAVGIPAVTLEAGGPMLLDEVSVSHGVKAIRTLLNQLGMLKQFSLWGAPEPVYYNSVWERAEHGGILFSRVELGARVKKGQLLGVVTDPITNVRSEIHSKHQGRILGIALNQVVQPGFAAYHVGIQAPKEQVSSPGDVVSHHEGLMLKSRPSEVVAGEERELPLITKKEQHGVVEEEKTEQKLTLPKE